MSSNRYLTIVGVGIVVAMVLLIVFSVLSLRISSRFQSVTHWAVHTAKVIEHIEKVKYEVERMETNLRNFKITQNSGLIVPFNRSRKLLISETDSLTALLNDNPVQISRLDSLLAIFQKQSMLTGHALSQDEFALARLDEHSHPTTDRLLVRMEEAEQKLLVDRHNEARAASSNALLLLVSGIALSFLIFLVVFIILRKGINQAKKAEQELDRFFTQSLDLLAIAGFDGYFKRLNPAWEKLLGMSNSELLSKPYLDFIHPDDRQATIDETTNLATGVETLAFTNRFQCADGSIKHLSWTASPTPESGVIYCVAKDITENIRSEEKFRMALESSSNSIIIVERNGLITTINSQTEKYFGYTRHELVGQPVEVLVPEARPAEHVKLRDGFFKKPLSRPMATGKELFGLRKDGSRFPVEIGLNPMHTEEGMFVLATISDITIQKQNESELTSAKDQAERANRMKSEFLNLMSHELRTPLTVMLGNLPLLTDPADLPDAEETAEIARDIEESGNHLLVLINDLLDISKIEAGRLELQPKPILVNDMVDFVLSKVETLTKKKGIELKKEVEDCEMEADPIRLRQILLNLLSNAIKFTDRGSVTLNVHPQADKVHFRVIDTGCGIKKEDQAMIFEKFKQADNSSTRKASGTGLGLVITKKLIELHNGQIRLESEPGKGSVFSFSLPMVLKAEEVLEYEFHSDH